MRSRGMKGLWLWMTLLAAVLFLPHTGRAGIPSVSEVRVTDVTTGSFSAVWIADEASTASLQVYHAPECTSEVSGIHVAGTASDGTGVIKTTVTGLSPNTAYCFQTVTTSLSTSETTVAPAAPQSVRTETQTVRSYVQGTDILPFGNDLIYHPVNRFDSAPGNGSILLVSVVGGGSPVSAWVGEGIASPDALADLNNVFSASTRENLNLKGGERMSILEVRGSGGCTLDRWRKVPQDNELVEVKPPGSCFIKEDVDCNDVINIVDVRRAILGYFSKSGDFCFNPDIDMDGSGQVNIIDIRDIIRHFGQRP